MPTPMLNTFYKFQKSRDAKKALILTMIGPEPACLVLSDDRWEICPLSQIPAGTMLEPTQGSRKLGLKVLNAGWSPDGRAVIEVPIPVRPKVRIKNWEKESKDRCAEGMMYALWFLIGSRPEQH
jgi:hypothetical protein